jgi:DNA-binding MarR family transcriptional regulator
MNTGSEIHRELEMLEQIERDPDISQASLAAQLGVAVGTINWYIKRLIAKGYVKVKRAQRRKLRYIITPEGLAFRARLTVDYIDQSMRLYRRVRLRVRELVSEAQQAGHRAIRIEGDGDIADICRLTCLEQGIQVTQEASAPVLAVQGTKVSLQTGHHTTEHSTQDNGRTP